MPLWSLIKSALGSLFICLSGTNIVLSNSNVFPRVNLSTYNSQASLRTLCQGDFFSFYFIQNIVSNTEMEITSEKSDMVTYKDTTQVARNMWVLFIWSKPLGKMGHIMLKWLVIYLLNKLALYSYKGDLCFKVIGRKYNRAANENLGLWFDCLKQKII